MSLLNSCFGVVKKVDLRKLELSNDKGKVQANLNQKLNLIGLRKTKITSRFLVV